MDAPPPNPSSMIVDFYLDDVVVHRQLFADTASWFALPLITTETTAYIQSDWMRTNIRSHLPGDWSAAFHCLQIDNSHSDLAPAGPSVPVLVPARLSVSLSAPTRIFVPVSSHAVVDYLPVGIPRRPQSSGAISSALRFPQEETTVAAELRNLAFFLVMALEASANILLISMDFP